MKKVIILFLSVILFSSCTIKETVVFDANMGGTFVTDMDMSQMMQMHGAGKNGEVLDTVINFSNFLITHQDSISKLSEGKQEALQKLKGYQLHMVQNSDKGIFDVSIMKKFSNFSDFQKIPESINNVYEEAMKSNADSPSIPGMSGSGLNKGVNVLYSFDGTVFTRTEPESKTTEEKQTDAQNKQMAQTMGHYFDQSSYTLTYTFPRKIVEVSNPNATISNNGKTMTLHYKMTDLMEKKIPKKLEIRLGN